MDELKRLASGNTFFLPFREIENAFLDASLIHVALSERAAQLEHATPELVAVEAALKREIDNVSDEHLYRERPAGGKPSTDAIVGSELLERLYWGFVKAKYDKESDGKRLAEIAMRDHPALL
jgi:hypothetical protein